MSPPRVSTDGPGLSPAESALGLRRAGSAATSSSELDSSSSDPASAQNLSPTPTGGECRPASSLTAGGEDGEGEDGAAESESPHESPLPVRIGAGSEQPSRLQTPSLYEKNVHVLPEEPKQHPSEAVVVSPAASRGRYARSRTGGASKERSTQCVRSRAGWASKERSTPEGVNMEEHAWRFHFTFPQPPRKYCASGPLSGGSVLPRQKKPPEVRNALREKRIALRQEAARYHAEVALCKYNRANNTKFELVEVRVIRLFFEFGGGCIHYNFTAKPEDHHSADGSSAKLFFSEVNANLRDENDVLLCCIVGENDAGRCYGCEGHVPAVVHPSSQAYGGGSSTCINFPGSDGSSDSD